ncbi:Pre protein translocase subunit Sec66-domain-containing protein [Lactifluus subvellereus]|nr:Pre protein translocase subunit Sec66-domain-containing protein [Lactifluus subvellereus]
MASVLVPVFYVLVVFGGLFTFGHFYRKRNANKPIEPYFPRHHERDTYVTLLQRTDPPASDALLKAALVRRAVADVQRILRLRDDKQALQNLLQKGSVGDDLWNSFLAAEKELEAEIVEVHAEANSFVEGWGQVLFQTASEMLANEKTRAIAEQIPLERARNEVKYGKKAPGAQTSTAPASPPTGFTTPKPSTSPKSSPSLSPPKPSAGADGVSSESEASPRTPRSAKKSKKRK